MTKTLLRIGLAGLVALAAFQGRASAQATPAPAPAVAPAPTEPTGPAAPPPVAVEPTSTPVPEPTPAPEVTTVDETATAAEAPSIAGWFRFDVDRGGFQPWVGATFPVGDVALATDVYIAGALGEFDIGPSFTVGSAILTPMLGIQTDFGSQRALAIVPQFYATVDTGSIYFEQWTQLYLYKLSKPNATSYLYLRNILAYEVSSVVALGVEIDLEVDIADKGKRKDKPADDLTLAYLPIGPHIKLAYGTASYLQLFAGFDVAAKARLGDGTGVGALAGRISFVHNW